MKEATAAASSAKQESASVKEACGLQKVTPPIKVIRIDLVPTKDMHQFSLAIDC